MERGIEMRSAIEKRISRRKFINEAIADVDQKTINELIVRLNAVSGLTMTFEEDGSYAFTKLRKTYGLFSNVRSIVIMKGKTSDPHLNEKVGYFGEELILKMTDLSLGTCWVGGTFDKTSFHVSSDETLVCVIVVGKVASPSLGEKVLRAATHRKVKPMAQRIVSDVALPQWVEKGMAAVLLAPSAMNTQKPSFKYRQSQLSAEVEDNYSMDMIDLGIAKRHFECETSGRFEWGNGAIFQVGDFVTYE